MHRALEKAVCERKRSTFQKKIKDSNGESYLVSGQISPGHQCVEEFTEIILILKNSENKEVGRLDGFYDESFEWGDEGRFWAWDGISSDLCRLFSDLSTFDESIVRYRDILCLETVRVDENLRSKGLGEQLVKIFASLESNAYVALLGNDIENKDFRNQKKVWKFYKRLGFEKFSKLGYLQLADYITGGTEENLVKKRVKRLLATEQECKEMLKIMPQKDKDKLLLELMVANVFKQR